MPKEEQRLPELLDVTLATMNTSTAVPTRRLGGAGTCDISALIHTCKPRLLNA